MDPRIQQVLDSINHDLRRSQSLAEMAESVNLSQSRFFYLFRLATNQSPGLYVRTVRIEEARKMLETTWLRVKDICTLLGIRNANHFVRDFRKLYGLAPIEYRKRHRAKSPGSKRQS